MMQTPRGYQSRLVLVGLALGVILALLIWPATRWLVRSQLALLIPTPASVAPWSVGAQAGATTARQRDHETARRHPNDLALQFADAVIASSEQGHATLDIRLRRLRELTRRFPERPTLYAAILRFATRDQVRIERGEEGGQSGPPARHENLAPPRARNTPEALAAFDRDAAEGERLDPDNAYFPFMRTIGLFAAHRDAEALAALQRAAHEPNWSEYANDEIEADWKLQEETFGTVGALPKWAFAAAVLFPHYSQLRAASRLAIARAVEAEQTGNNEEGLALRDAVRQCGGLIRVQATSAIGALVGIAIARSAMDRPGGTPPIAESPGGAREQRLHDYEAYLQRVGATERAAFEDAAAAGVRAREIVKTAVHSPFYDAPYQLAASWLAEMILLSNVLWMLALAGGAALLARWRPFWVGQGLAPVARPGAALGLLAGILLAGCGLLHSAHALSYLCLLGVLLSTLLVMTLPVAQGSGRVADLKLPHPNPSPKRRRATGWLPSPPCAFKRRSFGEGPGVRSFMPTGCAVGAWGARMKTFGLGLVGAALLCSAFAWQVDGSIEPIVRMVWGNGGDGGAPIAPRVAALVVGFAAALPLLTLFTLGLLSLAWRVPLSVGITRGLRGCALPLACALVMVYGLLVPMTLSQENALNAGMKRCVPHEGRFMAEMVGKRWPGPTR